MSKHIAKNATRCFQPLTHSQLVSRRRDCLQEERECAPRVLIGEVERRWITLVEATLALSRGSSQDGSYGEGLPWRSSELWLWGMRAAGRLRGEVGVGVRGWGGRLAVGIGIGRTPVSARINGSLALSGSAFSPSWYLRWIYQSEQLPPNGE